MTIKNLSKPSTSLTNSSKVSSAELWSTITPTWAAETRTWAQCASLMTASSKPTVVVDSYSETNRNTDFSPFHSATNNYLGQTFQASLSGYLMTFKFYLKLNGTPTGTMLAKLYAHTGTFGTNGQPTGSALATSDYVQVSILSTSLALITFTFSTPYKLVSGTNYCLLLDGTSITGDVSNYVAWGEDTTSPTHAGNRFSSSNGGSSYSTTNSVDMCFYAYVTNAGMTNTSKPS